MGLLALSLFAAGGCTHDWGLAYSRVDPASNPSNGPAVKIVSVTDERSFVADPGEIQTPTVENRKDIGNRAITVRAIGNAKNGAHTFYFTYVEGQSVETAVRGAVENALRRKGYIVVAPDSPAGASAIPVEVEINKSWCWWDPGWTTIGVLYDVKINLKSPIVLNGDTATATGRYEINRVYIVSAEIDECVGQGLDALSKDVETKTEKSAKLRKPGPF
jgi:hypothetical protein